MKNQRIHCNYETISKKTRCSNPQSYSHEVSTKRSIQSINLNKISYNTRLYEQPVPTWEKKFCSEIGTIPWEDFVKAKRGLLYNNVMEWDDSGAREAFFHAKNRFRAKFYGKPYGHMALPDPEAFIDTNIDWNPTIDPQLLSEIEAGDVDAEKKRMEAEERRRLLYSQPVVPTGWDWEDKPHTLTGMIVGE